MMPFRMSRPAPPMGDRAARGPEGGILALSRATGPG